MLLRPALPADQAALADLYLRARRAAFTWRDPMDFQADDFIRDTEGELIHLAESPHGEILGFLSLWEPDRFIHHLFIAPDHLRQGIGRALLADLHRRLPGPFRLKCLTANLPALAFYQKLGWAQVDRGTNEDGNYILFESHCDRSTSWLGSISEAIEYNGPMQFTELRLASQDHLFFHRGALFYTPTTNIPPAWIGSEEIDVFIPVAPPDWTEASEIQAYLSPRLWVDLIQRHTGRIRWMPFNPAKVIFTRYDRIRISDDHFQRGTKGLLDALKVRTFGRRDGLELHYFGAIEDDSHKHVRVIWNQRFIKDPRNAGVRVQVKSWKQPPIPSC